MKSSMRQIVIFASLIVAFAVPSQSSAILLSVPYEAFSHTVLHLPDNPRYEKPWLKIIRNQQDWEAHFYATTAAITFPASMAPVAPVLDFENYQVISGGLGVRSSGGYALAVESVVDLVGDLYIHVLDIRPGSSCLVTMATTYPSVTILVKKTAAPIQISVAKLINQCAE